MLHNKLKVGLYMHVVITEEQEDLISLCIIINNGNGESKYLLKMTEQDNKVNLFIKTFTETLITG